MFINSGSILCHRYTVCSFFNQERPFIASAPLDWMAFKTKEFPTTEQLAEVAAFLKWKRVPTPGVYRAVHIPYWTYSILSYKLVIYQVT